jgi:DNA-binding GntR family transcriptional regulator
MEKTQKQQARRVQDSVYTALRNSIINLNLAPGTAISEKEISLRFNVSRTPVREAFIRLLKEDLIRVIPQKETQVSLIDLERVEQEFFIRESLETAALAPFIANSRSHHLTELRRLTELQNDALANKAFIDFINYDDQFHQTFFEVAGQALSWEVLETMNGHYHRVRLLTIWLNGIATDNVSQHQQILAAMEKKDLNKAKEMLRLHLHKLETEEAILRKKFPDYFTPEEEKSVFDVDFGGLPIL